MAMVALQGLKAVMERALPGTAWTVSRGPGNVRAIHQPSATHSWEAGGTCTRPSSSFSGVCSRPQLPVQKDGINCGFYVALFARQLARGLPPSVVTHEAATQLRKLACAHGSTYTLAMPTLARAPHARERLMPWPVATLLAPSLAWPSAPRPVNSEAVQRYLSDPETAPTGPSRKCRAADVASVAGHPSA